MNIFKGMSLFLFVAGFWLFPDKNNPPLFGFSIEGFPISKTQLNTIEQETKIKAKIIQFYLQWPTQDAKEFISVRSSLQAIHESGALPTITWEPMTIVGNTETAISYELILSGSYDHYLKFIADEVKAWKKPIVIRFAHEMNLQRYHWGTTEALFGEQSPEIYIKMFRYLVNFFDQYHVDNVFWAFCPNVDSVPDTAWNQPKNYYPGDRYVDLFGMDGYNWNITPEVARQRQLNWNKPWSSFEQIFKNLYNTLREIDPDLPIAVFETATVNRNKEEKATWLKEALQTAQAWKLWAIIWFQSNKEEDWRIES